ncbi:Uncharacterised protein [Vibrio cholerae]|nr:Uncharacterised protein [Vibrio cholerae]
MPVEDGRKSLLPHRACCFPIKISTRVNTHISSQSRSDSNFPKQKRRLKNGLLDAP